ncbi:hypothetical protein RvY_12260 [Ramazzottius varieornatus]|uniref:Uncharacterized protein n=1 Tax=Ramazzottius varieornatus TaxID=947166 RepID=A0A1D1VSN2_RAMVA|nr:hypothetical protein RvY_12260 [Ramazzottius varieornatus]
MAIKTVAETSWKPRSFSCGPDTNPQETKKRHETDITACYGILSIPTGDWFCSKCAFHRAKSNGQADETPKAATDSDAQKSLPAVDKLAGWRRILTELTTAPLTRIQLTRLYSLPSSSRPLTPLLAGSWRFRGPRPSGVSSLPIKNQATPLASNFRLNSGGTKAVSHHSSFGGNMGELFVHHAILQEAQFSLQVSL